MGVMGAGKTMIARGVADTLCRTFLDADDFHPPENRKKLAAGIPLTDEDRWPWLDVVGEMLAATPGAVLACSALKARYRARLEAAAGPALWVWLDAPRDGIAARLAERQGHFADPALLDSQYAALEPPVDALRLDALAPAADLIQTIAARAIDSR
jgi:gluconokinase